REPRRVVPDRGGEVRIHGEAVAGQADGGLEELAPRLGAEALVCGPQPCHGAGNAGGEVAGDGAVGGLAALVEVHVAGRGEGRAFAEVEGGGATVREVRHHEAAAADVARLRVHHGEGERGRDRCV